MRQLHFEVLTSTSDHAKGLMAEHRDQRLLVSCDRQTAGRGRSGRGWQSPVGGAWFSIVWPTQEPQERYTALPLVVGLAVLHRIKAAIDGSKMRASLSVPGRVRVPQLKWPNDILIDGRKIAGILCERVVSGGHAAIVIGVGINVNNDPPVEGLEVRGPAASLRVVIGRGLDVKALIHDSTDQITYALEAFEREGLTADLCEQITDELAWVGDRVELIVGDRLIEGELVGIDRQGRLRLKTAEGVAIYQAGEVRRLRCQTNTTEAAPR